MKIKLIEVRKATHLEGDYYVIRYEHGDNKSMDITSIANQQMFIDEIADSDTDLEFARFKINAIEEFEGKTKKPTKKTPKKKKMEVIVELGKLIETEVDNGNTISDEEA